MCSSTRGPATVPSLVTWPTIKTETPSPFASPKSTEVASRTWETLPGAELEFSLYMVWMESMITVCGRTSRMVSEMMSRFVSQNRRSLSEKLPIRAARILICFKDSSPEIYRTSLPSPESFWQT